MTTQNIAELISTIQSMGDPTATSSFRTLLARVGNPHLKLPPTIHVAGTNGKGSTLAFLDSILRQAGLKVHRYTSPHLVSVCERIQTANHQIKEDVLERHLQVIKQNGHGLNLSFFEIMTAAAFLEFSSTPADFVLLETGIGGRLDPTNVVEKPVACIITQIGYDHLEWLGSSLSGIAQAKAGIIKEGCPVITYSQDSIIMKEIEEEASLKQSPLYIAKTRDFKTGLLGSHQKINASLAARTAQLLEIPDELIKKGLVAAQWPGRMQRVTYYGREIWLDMAHNASAARVATRAMQDQGLTPFHLIFSLRDSKDLEGFMDEFNGKLLSATYIPMSTYYASGHRPESVQQCNVDIRFSESVADAIASTPEGPILITGSAILLGKFLELPLD